MLKTKIEDLTITTQNEFLYENISLVVKIQLNISEF